MFRKPLIFHSKQSRGSNVAVSKVFEAKNEALKMLWILILLAGIVASVYQIISFAESFLNYPVVVALKKDAKNSDQYPAITVCNMNPMKNIYDDCIKEENIPDFCNIVDFETDMEYDKGLFEFPMPFSMTLSSLNKTLNLLKLSEIDFINRYAKLDAMSRMKYGTQAIDFIKYCSFRGFSCFSDDFELTQHIRFGNCYTFKPPSCHISLFEKPSLFSNTDELVIVLNLETNSYIEYLSMGVSALVTVHDASEKPNVEEKSVLVSPGFETLLKVRITETKRLPAPYKDKCMDYRSQSVNPSDCILLCIQKINQEKCSCVDPTVDAFVPDALTCNITDIENMRCLNDVIRNLLIYQSRCNCNVPCISTDYNVQVWRSSWPSKAHFENYLRYKLKLMKWEDFELVKDAYAFLKIHLESAKEVIEQKPKYDTSEIFSCLGGSLGLYLGISCISIFEILEILFAILKLRFNY